MASTCAHTHTHTHTHSLTKKAHYSIFYFILLSNVFSEEKLGSAEKYKKENTNHSLTS